MNSGKARSNWLVYLLLALIVGTGWLVREITVRETYTANPIRNDATQFYLYAVNLKYFGVFSETFVDPGVEGAEAPLPDAKRSPGYPLFLSSMVVYPPTFDMLEHIRRIQSLLDVLTVLLVFSMARLLMPAPLALLPTLFTAISPHLISMVTYPLSETLFTFLVTATAAVGMYAASRPRPYLAWFGYGALLGLCFLVKMSMIYVLMFVLPALFAVLSGKRRAVLAGLCVAMAYTLVVLPWELRNTGNIAEGTDVHTAHGVVSVHNGTYPDLLADAEGAIRGFPHRFDPHYNEYDSYSRVLLKLWNNTLEEPGRYLGWYLWGKPEMFFSWSIIAGYGDIFQYAMEKSPFFTRPNFQRMHAFAWYSHWPLVIMALLTALLCWLPVVSRKFDPRAVSLLRLCSLPVLYLLALAVVTTPLPRYSIPLRPLLYVLAAAGAWQCVAGLGRGSASSLYAGWDPVGIILSNWRVRAVKKLLPPGVHLDIACGDNRLVKALGRGYGIDITAYPGVHVTVKNFSSLPFRDESLDSASILAALNYFEAPEKTLQELHRSLKPGGVVVITLLSKTVSRYWHMLRDRGLPRITFDEEELRSIVARTDLQWRSQGHFMLGVNRLIVLEKPA